MSNLKKVFGIILMLMFGLFLVEIGLHLGYLFSSKMKAILSPPTTSNGEFRRQSIVKHKLLKNIGNPKVPEIDDWGFRNHKVLNHADVVILGDSQTFGFGVNRGESWPSVLAEITGKTVYNMAIPGYGPAQSLLLKNFILEMKPNVVIQAVYSGNDLWDSEEMFSKYVSEGMLDIDNALDTDHIIYHTHDESVNFSTSEDLVWYRKYLSRYCRTYGFSRRLRAECIHFIRVFKDYQKTPDQRWDDTVSELDEFQFPFDENEIRTIFTPNKRLMALDMSSDRIKRGFENIKTVTFDLNDFFKSKGIRFIVVFIPTKEYAYSNYGESIENDGFQKLISQENVFWEKFRDSLHQQDVEFCSPILSMQNAIQNKEHLYFETDNGHPAPLGHVRIAEHVSGCLN